MKKKYIVHWDILLVRLAFIFLFIATLMADIQLRTLPY